MYNNIGFCNLDRATRYLATQRLANFLKNVHCHAPTTVTVSEEAGKCGQVTSPMAIGHSFFSVRHYPASPLRIDRKDRCCKNTIEGGSSTLVERAS